MDPRKHPFPYPEPGSLLSKEAVKWYLESVLRIPEVISQDQEPHEMLPEVWEVKSRLRLAAALALVDPFQSDRFLLKMPMPTIESLLDSYAPDHEDAERQAIERLLTVSDEERCAFPTTVGGAPVAIERPAPRKASANEGAGVSYGNLVRTPSGSKPIQEIRPGDLVMSAPPDGNGGTEAKRVREVVVHERRPIHFLAAGMGTDKYQLVAATEDLPFWLEDHGWTRLDALQRYPALRTDYGSAEAIGPYRVFRTGEEGVGWFTAERDWRTGEGSRFDFAKRAAAEKVENPYVPQEVANGLERYLRLPVYNLDVENFHTFFVSSFWVRGTGGS